MGQERGNRRPAQPVRAPCLGRESPGPFWPSVIAEELSLGSSGPPVLDLAGSFRPQHLLDPPERLWLQREPSGGGDGGKGCWWGLKRERERMGWREWEKQKQRDKEKEAE